MRYLALLSILALLLAACDTADSDSQLAPPEPTATRPAAALLTPPAQPRPVEFPRDEAPHDNLTEWWYYTGHLFTASGDRYGFEFVVFQIRRANFPAYYASHFAITDNQVGELRYAERTAIEAAQSADQGFHLDLGSWRMSGAGGTDRLQASMDGYAIDLLLEATGDPVLHGQGTGYIDFGPAGGSYYYSRPGMEVTGRLTVRDETLDVTGQAWMDHQWGNFVVIDGGGWDWFALELDTGDRVMLARLRGINGVGDAPDFGTLIRSDGSIQYLNEDQFTVKETDTWTSPNSGATYPSGWTITIPEEGWQIEVTPAIRNQELITLKSTSTIYWEGEVVIEGTLGDMPVTGLGYVELTGYARDREPG